MNMLVNLLLTWLCLIHNAYFSATEDSVPAQEKCQIHNAIIFNPAVLAKLPKEWFVARATLRTVLPQGVPEPTINSCAPLSYLQTCQGGMYVENIWDKNGGLTKITKAYSKQYDNVVEYWETQSRVEANYFIYQGFGTSMTLHFRNKKWKEIPTYDFPDLVIHAQARMYAMTEYGYTMDNGEIEWVLYQACDEDFAWIEIAQWVIKANRLHEVNLAIDDVLGSNLLTIPQMVKLITVLPFKVSYMYALTAYGFLLDTGEVDWALYLDYDDDFAWIEIPKFVIEDQKLLDMVNANIDEYLQEPRNPLIVPQMVKLETELPF